MPQKIDVRSVGQIRAAFALNRHAQVAAKLVDATLTLPAALEIAGWLEDASHNDAVGRSHLETLTGRCRTLAIARDLLKKQGANHAQASGAGGVVEISTITELTAEDRRWNEYWQRFATALKSAGFEKQYADALGYSLHEMADNVVMHSRAGLPGNTRAPGIAAWNISGDVAAFAVIDLGQGMRQSLRQNPAWKDIASDQEALQRVAVDHATRIADNEYGDGYRDVLKNFVNRNGCVTIRSGTAELVATSDGLTPTYKTFPGPEFIGTRMAAWCAPRLTATPAEPEII